MSGAGGKRVRKKLARAEQVEINKSNFKHLLESLDALPAGHKYEFDEKREIGSFTRNLINVMRNIKKTNNES